MTTRLAAYAGDGTPLAGLTPSWSAYFNAETGEAITGPTFTPLGGGLYAVDVPANESGIADFGATALNRYVFLGSTSVVTFPAFALADGAPLASLTPEWNTIRDASGTVIASEPTFTELGGGIYKVVSMPSGAVGIVDLGATANPELTLVDNAAASDTSAPVVGNVSPPAGTPLARFDPVSLDVTDSGSGLRVVILVAKFPGALVDELVHDGTDFGALYAGGSTRSTITGGYRYTLARMGGWPGQLILVPYAVDQAGNENA